MRNFVCTGYHELYCKYTFMYDSNYVYSPAFNCLLAASSSCCRYTIQKNTLASIPGDMGDYLYIGDCFIHPKYYTVICRNTSYTTNTCTHAHTYTHGYACIYVHAYAYTYIIHTHTHTHTQVHTSLRVQCGNMHLHVMTCTPLSLQLPLHVSDVIITSRHTEVNKIVVGRSNR